MTHAPNALESSFTPGSTPGATLELDLTAERCPMTFVRVRLALDALPADGRLRVRLRGEEARRNVTLSATALGCRVTPVTRIGTDAILEIAKGAGGPHSASRITSASLPSG